ncbi:phospholipase D-like domain-containing protein [Amycolatopsis sp. PS_44_ISF1]|uniref:phospholipase D-like domain-containing protein n=1 Tax=Amycolatopsis sp. PS_44_ISF1 TaxID=2974917 RepID=UPI0028E062BD|nr:phospholipase D-like domain-containing protein [Amycolatopsis sp. PS_44_ISF1]MDT8913037.1 phospholipase D-like domain-containing protein [Amycolatopsis sp. PS_44_ISF1]
MRTIGLTGVAVAAIAVLGSSSTALAAPAASSPAHTVFTEPGDHWQSVYDAIGSARSTLDLTMYELVDTTARDDLVADAGRGVKVRVILDHQREAKHNQAAYTYLNAHGVPTVWAPEEFEATHQKTLTVDGRTSVILSGNLTSRYYATGRDFGVVDRDGADVSAIEKVFDADFAGDEITPPTGDDLVWSPTNSQSALLKLIDSATTSLAVENEEMALPAVVDALTAAAGRGVAVKVTMTYNSSYRDNFDTLVDAGVQVGTYANTKKSLYIHAKVIVADYGKPSARVFVGSENFSHASLTGNRELGLITSDPAVLDPVDSTVEGDFAGARPWTD